MIEAVVPVRGLPAGKSRLAALLAPEQRNQLVRAMLGDVVQALRAAGESVRVRILSADEAAAREAERLGVGFLRQPAGITGLNEALRWAQETADGDADAALLIVPADLPLLAPDDLRLFLGAVRAEPNVVIAPSSDGGTNGLLLYPPAVIAPQFGPDSAGRHIAAGRAVGATVTVVESRRWAQDVDHPEDLARVLALAGSVPDGARRETVRRLRSPGFPTAAAPAPREGGC